jgi:hypothetical protein
MRESSRRLLAIDDLDASFAAGAAQDDARPVIPKPDELGWWDWAVFLLHTAAEIEHVLMVQYLYAAYSLADADFRGPAVPTDAAAQTAAWRTKITKIAKEEMAHLLTEQNLLRFIDAPLNIEREDFPFRSALYPFPLSLEPLSRMTLAKYVVAEMPADPQAPELDTIVALAQASAGGMVPNRVGIIFDTLIDVFSDSAKLPDTDFRPQTATTLQATSDDWFGFSPDLIVRRISTRDQAVAALRAVGEQGEGSDEAPPGAPQSHFDQFLNIYRAFPEHEDLAASTWVPTRQVPVNPTTSPAASRDPSLEAARITHPVTRLWAQLFNVRYRMVLADLAHALQLDGPLADGGAATPRGLLRDWTFLQMRGRGGGGMKGLAQVLTRRPAKPGGESACAGPPFELPYTLTIPDTEHGRWRLHLALLNASAELIDHLRDAGDQGLLLEGEAELLDQLTSIDAEARTTVQEQLSAP